MRSKLLLLASAAVAAVCFAGSAQALTYTQTATFGPAVTDFNGTGAGKTSILLFDTNGGTLNSITFSSSYGFNSSVTVSNTAQNASVGDVFTRSASQFSAGTAAATSALNTLVNTAGSFTTGGQVLNPTAFKLNGTDQSYSLAAGASQTVQSTATTTSTGPFTDTTSADLAAFSSVGSASLDILFSTLTGAAISNNGGNTSATQNTQGTGTLTISYNYTTQAAPPPPPPAPVGVPEPASMLVLGTGLVGLGLARRLRRS